MRYWFILTLAGLFLVASCGKPDAETRSQLIFSEPFDKLDERSWKLSDQWANGLPFQVGWRKDQLAIESGHLTLSLSQAPCSDPAQCSNYTQAAGEAQTRQTFGYGSYTARLKAAKGSGLVTGFFTYIGANEGQPHDEIDVEILGKNTSQVQFNYYTNGNGSHEKIIDLGFDSSVDFHDYRFDWSAGSISWYVDGVLKHQATTDIPSHPGHIFLNLWAGIGVDSWLGPFTYTGPLSAQVDQVTWEP